VSDSELSESESESDKSLSPARTASIVYFAAEKSTVFVSAVSIQSCAAVAHRISQTFYVSTVKQSRLTVCCFQIVDHEILYVCREAGLIPLAPMLCEGGLVATIRETVALSITGLASGCMNVLQSAQLPSLHRHRSAYDESRMKSGVGVDSLQDWSHKFM
jgi:hypothetical protein